MRFVLLIPVLLAGAAWGGPAEEGARLEAEGRFRDAASVYAEQVKRNPEDRDGRVSLIRVLISSGQTEEAGRLLAKEMETGPSDKVLLNERGRLSFARGDYRNAEKEFRDALKVSPGSPDVRHNLGVALQRLDRAQEARDLFEQLLEDEPEYVPALNALALMAVGRGDLTAALDLLKRAEAKNPDDFETLFNSGSVREARGEHDESARYFSRAVSARKSDAGARERYARALIQLKRYDAASVEVETALSLDPDLVTAVVTLGVLHEEQGRVEEAKAQYERALKMDPRRAEAAFRLGNLSLAESQAARVTGDEAAARAAVEAAVLRYSEAIKGDEKHVEARYNLAVGLLELGRVDKAMEEASRLVKGAPNQPQYQMLLAAIATRAGRAEQALKAYRAAARLDSKCLECRLRLGSLAMNTGNLAEAVNAYREALKLDGSNADARYSLGMVLFRQGELKAAKREVARVLEARPESADVMNALANIDMRMRDLTEAGILVGKAVDADPAYLPAFRTAELLFAQSANIRISGSPKTVRILTAYLRGLQAQNKTAEAIAAFSEIVKLEPKCAAAQVKLGMLNVLSGNNRKGLAHLEEAKRLVPNDPEIHYAIATGYYNLGEGSSGKTAQNHYRKAYDSYREAVRLSPQYAEAYWGMGSAMYKLKRYDLAREALEECLKVNPFFSEAYNTYGSVIAQQAQAAAKPAERKALLEEAVQLYQQSLRANPNSEMAHYNLGTMYHELKRYEEAIEAYEAALRLAPGFPLARYRLARLYAERGKWPFDRGRAEKEFEQLMLVVPGDCSFLYDFGAFYFNTRKYEKAKEKWGQVLKMCPENQPAQDGLERLIDMGY